MMSLRRHLGLCLGRYLSQQTQAHAIAAPTRTHLLRLTLRPADVLLVEGLSRVSSAIKYLTQSTWSHAALYVGPQAAATALAALGQRVDDEDPPCFVEADMVHGVRVVGFKAYAGLHTRICRAISLSTPERDRVLLHALSRVGHRYDMRNVVDLSRYLMPTPPVPARWRRRMLALGSGDPTRAICSTLIAEAFQQVRYPILPKVEVLGLPGPQRERHEREVLHVRHHSLYVPRDFDVSPYFAVIKPTLELGFDHRELVWSDAPTAEGRQAHPA